ncbi:MAG: signal recognition particle protein, partial [Bacilli bacterium]|nr:signal recognition particle protein [Bacilli bacterium]
LGMGDVVTLVEKVKEEIDEKEAAREANKMLEGKFTLDDLIIQMKRIQRMGSLGGLLRLIPGMPKITEEQKEAGEREMRIMEAIVNSMTPYERQHPEILKNSRKVRIAKGCGKTNADINRLLKKFEQMQEMMKRMQQYKKTGRMPPGMNLPGGGFGAM